LNDSERVSSSGGEENGCRDRFLYQLALAGYEVVGEYGFSQARKTAISLN
jgi:hypothetical protein